MKKKGCKNSVPCNECDDAALTTSAPCGNGDDCQGDECPETFAAGCVVWTGAPVICDSVVMANTGERLDVIIARMISFFCGEVTEGRFHLLVPDANAVLSGADDLVISIDRNACFNLVTITPDADAPAGLLFNYINQNGDTVSDSPNIIMAATQSSVVFNINTTAVAPGTYNFNYQAVACGVTVLIPQTITVT